MEKKPGGFKTSSLSGSNAVNLKCRIKRATMYSLILLFLVGGGLEFPGGSLKTGGLPDLIKSISEYHEKAEQRILQHELQQQDLKMRQILFQKMTDSLDILKGDEREKMIKRIEEFLEKQHLQK